MRATDPSPVCFVCGTPGALFYGKGRDRLFRVARGNFSLYRCETCGCIFQWPLPVSEEIPHFYPASYWWNPRSGGSRRGLLEKLEGAYRELVTMDHVRFLQRCAGKSTHKMLLDIGCGNGTFLYLARARGFVAHGLESSERAVSIARERYQLQVRCGEVGSDVWGVNKFDYITMFHVLEHLREPREALAFVRRMLRPNGSFIVQVPNLASLQARIFRKRWYGLDVPRHIVNFTPEGLVSLLQQEGFEIRSTKRFSLRDNPASLASSVVPGLDPIGRKGRVGHAVPGIEQLLEIAYFGLFLLALPVALLESILGRGGTIWFEAKIKTAGSRQSAVGSGPA